MSNKNGFVVAKRTFSLVAAIGAICLGALVVDNAIRFHQIVEMEESTGSCCSWYSTSWLENPYTLWKLQGAPYEDRSVKNEVGDAKTIRDVQYGKAGFWTELGPDKDS